MREREKERERRVLSIYLSIYIIREYFNNVLID
jgi:hypothetical protein